MNAAKNWRRDYSGKELFLRSRPLLMGRSQLKEVIQRNMDRVQKLDCALYQLNL